MATDPQGAARRGGPHRFALALALLGVLALVGVAVGFTPGRSSPTGPSIGSPAPLLASHPDIAALPTSGWKLALADSFTGRALDGSLWHTCYPWGCTILTNPEDEWYARANVTTGARGLDLTARPQPTHGRSYTSGMVQSNGFFDFRYGVVEVRAKVPPGVGTWPAIWLVPENQQWPPEIDVMEYWGSQPGQIRVSLHFSLRDQIEDRLVDQPGFTTSYHTYAVDWEPHSISWYLDGKLVFSVARSISQPMYPIMNLAVADQPPPLASTFPAHFDISWIHIFTRDGVSSSTCNAPSCVVG